MIGLEVGFEVRTVVVDGVDTDGCFTEVGGDETGVDFKVGIDVVVEPRLSGGLRFKVEVEVETKGTEYREVKEGRDVDVPTWAGAKGAEGRED